MKRPMRRKEREVTDPARIREILQSCKVCRLGLQDGKRVYVVPLNFGAVEKDGRWNLYFHGAKAGRKIDLIRQNGYAGFEMDTSFQLTTDGPEACDYTANYQSIIGEGSIGEVEDLSEKELALNAIMRQYTGKDSWRYPQAMLKAVGILRLSVEELSCKEHQ